MSLKNLFGLTKAKSEFLPENTEFDHLYGEYLSLASNIPAGSDEALLEDIHSRRLERKLSWNGIYTFELILLKYLPLDNLRHKILSLRSRYQSIAGQKTYDAYMASKLSDPTAKPPDDPAAYGAYLEALRADARYLLDEVYLLYAAVPAREGLGKWLTVWSGALTLVLLVIIIGLFIASVVSERTILLPIGVVFLSGAMGGFFSMIQRLKAAPAEGDPIYNLSTFWHGAYSLFLSPLTGAIFAVLLYFMFTGNILQGRFFPTIANPTATQSPTPTRTPTPTPTPTPPATVSPTVSPTTTPATPAPTVTPTASPSPPPTASPSPSATVRASASPQPTASPSPTATPSRGDSSTAQASPKPPSESLSFKDFLTKSGPGDARDYALLLIWCFIAGLAERFVPDTLTRLVAQGQEQSAGKGTAPGKPEG